jgi:photosystem II stability/assembly factor-like uncharacterized protein
LDIVARTSADGGLTWSAISFVYKQVSVDFLVALHDARTDKIHLMLQVNGTVTVYLTSSDAGASWSKPVTLTFPRGPFTHAFPGVGHGIQLNGNLCSESSCGGAVGRLVLPFVCKGAAQNVARPVVFDVSCAGCYSCLLVSDDSGLSWRIAAASIQVCKLLSK